MSVLQILVIVLALSAAGDAWVVHLWLGQRDKTATALESVKVVSAAASSCSAGVDALKAESDARQAAVVAALEENRVAIASLQIKANKALSAKPANVKDLCGSLLIFFKQRIDEGKAAP